MYLANRVPGEPTKKPVLVAKAACSISLDRSFDFEKDFLHAQGEILQERARCHVLIDCDYRESEPDLKNVDLQCFRVVECEPDLNNADLKLFRVVEGERSFYLVKTNVTRGRIDAIPWGRHSS
ncbi:hypothetical protein V493_07258 [Pseudogymnoascus sp. VKM F-4281 (FW-2241)]|nr:hypothetical protein V493_07258 [Pseudogymnoascus sp. VKM F-4281 (FW-2241)]